MSRAIIYCRVSSEEQVKGFSLENQERICRDYCERNHWNVIKVFIEPGESAKTVNRPAFKEALEFCRHKENAVEFFVIYAISRFCRNTEDHVVVAARLRKYGVNLRSASEPIDESHMGRFMENVLASFADLDNGMRAQACLGGLKSALGAGQWPFLAPLGYRNQKNIDNKPIIVADDERGPLIRLAFEKFATERYSIKQVHDESTALGLKTRSGKKVPKQTFHKILRNPFYAGWLVVSKWSERRRGNFEALVEQDTFDRVQAILAGRNPNVTPHQRNRPDFPLRGLAKCGKCGGAMTGGWSTGRSKRYPYYHCSKNCKGMNLRAEELEQQFLLLLNSFGMRPKLIASYNEIMRDVWKQKNAEADQLTAAHQRRLGDLKERRQRLFDAFIYMRAINEVTFHEQSKQLDDEVADVNLALVSASPSALNIDAVLEFTGQVMSNAGQLWAKLSLDQKQMFCLVLFPNGFTITEDGEIGTAASCCPFELLQQKTPDKSVVVEHLVSSWNQVLVWLRQMDQLRQSLNSLPAAA